MFVQLLSKSHCRRWVKVWAEETAPKLSGQSAAAFRYMLAPWLAGDEQLME